MKFPFLTKPLPKFPFGKKIWASRETYLKLHKNAISDNRDYLKQFEKLYEKRIDIKWYANLALHTQVVIKKEKLNFDHGRILYSVLNDYIARLKSVDYITIFETGTARGFSAICMAKALVDSSKPGKIISIDCISHNESIYWNCIDDLEGPKTRNELLSKWSEELSRIVFIQGWTDSLINRIGLDRINFAFLDAQHTKEAVLREFLFVSEKQKKGDLIVFDDVTPGFFDGVCKAVNLISEKYNYDVEYLNFKDDRGYAIAKKK